MVLIVLAGFCYALHRIAVSYNITPWKWIRWYVVAFLATFLAVAVITSVAIVMTNADPQNLVNDKAFVLKVNQIAEKMLPFVLLYQLVLFFIFRGRILKYVHNLDQLEKVDNTPTPSSPPSPKKEDKDLSYFR
ncbi:MAG: hypothetical protein JWO03_1595 [Bacteroidetes bacterium]|nr:hypothetical protein [Bacteroidota bacterium]